MKGKKMKLQYILLNIKNIKLLPWYYKTLKNFKSTNQRKDFKVLGNFPVLWDKNSMAGSVGAYLYQDLWAAKKIAKASEEIEHFDIGSRVDGFITHLLCFRKNVTLIDIRPLPYYIDEGLNFIEADATTLSNIEDHSIKSLSALCSLEHFGLGRYGDPIDPEACFKVFNSIQRVMAKGGVVYISLPIGAQRVEFNAHRIFYPKTVVAAFSKMELSEFIVVNSSNKKHPLDVNPDLDKYNNVASNGEIFGLFEFKMV